MRTKEFEDYFRTVPKHVNVDAIRDEWLAINHPYSIDKWLLPLPVWAHRPFEQSGAEAWFTLQDDLAKADPQKPMCIYLHSPFCSSKCGYCDCYSFKLGKHEDTHIQNYVDRLCYEMRLWSEVGNLRHRPISSMHMGGGTPTYLGEAAISQIVETCKVCFNFTDETEIALESTVQSLTDSMIETMHGLGYRRLHIGVESLEAHVRTVIGRRRPVSELLERIRRTLDLGWIVSVDLVCGLPEQSLEGFLSGIQTLIDTGVNGFSIYELLIYPQNRKWAEQHNLTDREHLENYWMYQAGASLLLEQGFQTNLFNHWVDARDTNIYFTFPTRFEDCLAIGTIADGVFGDYHFRHPKYTPYMRASENGFPGLTGGLRRTPYESEIHPLIVGIQSGYLKPELISAYKRPSTIDGTNLIDRWLETKLIFPDAKGGFRLTTNGSWFTGNMIKEMTGLYPAFTHQS